MMKTITIAKYAFTLVGVGMLVGALFAYQSTNTFLAESARTEGTVIDLEKSASSGSTIYKPVVKFVSKDGQSFEFVTSAGSNPPSYSKGEKVEVLYRISDPQNAKINSFFSLWGGAVILGGMGGLFLLIGLGIILVGTLKGRKDEYLRKYGIPIETEFQRVEVNTALSVNGRNPFQVLTHWQNPATSELHVFRSDNLWFDPSSFITTKKITVFIEKDNPKKYFVDLSYLPKLAK